MSSGGARFVASISAARDTGASWKSLEDLAQAIAGHRLFTVMTVDLAAGVVRRAYSNRPGEYPTSGTKPLHGNTGAWFDTVFERRQTFVANTIDDIAEVFPDHELIGSMGLGSVVNYPVVLEGALVAAINLLDVAGHYTPERVAAIESELAIPARLCSALALRFDASPTGSG
ncbi:MAG: GAF domain-containing protein [Devosia sp.]